MFGGNCARALLWSGLLALADLACLRADSLPQVDAGRKIVRTWATDSGLPQNTVNAILQTRPGYLWVGTRDGLARFDGVRFRVFGLPEGMQSVDVSSLYEDRYGTLWIGTIGGGLSRFRNGRIETFNPRDEQLSTSITSLAEDFTGRLWIGTGAGVVQLASGIGVANETLEVLKGTPIRALLCDREGAMWIATSTHGLFRHKNGKLNEVPGPVGDESISAYCLLEDHLGGLWASVGNGKVLRLSNGTWRVYSQSDGLPFAYVTCLAEDANGIVWAGSLDSGLYFFDSQRFAPLTQANGTTAGDIRCLRPDREGNLWVGTRTAGLSRLSEPKLAHAGAEEGLTNDFTRSITQTRDGTIWVATIGGGLYRGDGRKFSAFSPDALIRFYPQTESVLETEDGSLWWGGARALLCWREGKLAGCYTNQPWVRSATVTALEKDGHNGLWIGTSQSKLIHWRNGAFKEFPEPVARGPVTALAHDGDGTVWVGSLAGGLARVDEALPKALFVTNGLSSQSIRALYRDPEGTLWIGTAGGGLGRWRGGQLHNFTAQDGLGVTTVSQILEDDWGCLWLGSSRGICRLPKNELEELAARRTQFLHPKIFGLNDGMPAEECSSGSCPTALKTQSGLLCFPTVKGLVVLDPSKPDTNSSPPLVHIEEILANNSLQTPLLQSRGTPSDEAPAQSIVLAAGNRELEIHYTGISFAAPEKVSFRYRLEEFDRGWVEAGGRRTAYYHQVPPGNYVFRVSACSRDGIWNEQGAALGIALRPYLWERSWFLAASVAAGALLMAGATRFAVQRRFRRRLAILETGHAIDRERFRISQDMHDHLGGMLTQVSQLSDLGQNQTSLVPQAQAQFQRIGAQARAAVQALDEIVWATNPRNDNLASFVEYVSRFADEFFENTKVRCWQDVPGAFPSLALGADIRHNIFLAVRESLNNVLKHAAASEVWLRIALQGSEVRVEIEDNGAGFDRTLKSTGNGLLSMRRRLNECGGSADVKSSIGGGTTVRFVFPVSAELQMIRGAKTTQASTLKREDL